MNAIIAMRVQVLMYLEYKQACMCTYTPHTLICNDSYSFVTRNAMRIKIQTITVDLSVGDSQCGHVK